MATPMQTLSKQDVEDLLVGAKIMGTGGGGLVSWARPMIDEVFASGKEFRLIDPADLPDDKLTFIVATLGGGVPKEIRERLANLPRMREKPVFAAVRELAKYLGEEPYAILPCELGPGNTIGPMYVAAMLGKPVVDGDCCGRAKPEMSQCLTNVAGIPATPLSIVSPFGDVMILKSALDNQRAEQIIRQMAVASGGTVGEARTPVKGRDIKRVIVPNSLSKCVKIGRAIREARSRRENPVEAFMKVADGRRIFEGEVEAFEREEREAFMWGTILIRGTGSFEESRLKVWYKNEFLVSWRDEKPYASCPDSICILDADSGEGLTNWENDFIQGRRVAVVGLRAASQWRTMRGVRIFDPKHYGFNIEYTPIESLQVESIRRKGAR
jgi:DUF917 family protein